MTVATTRPTPTRECAHVGDSSAALVVTQGTASRDEGLEILACHWPSYTPVGVTTKTASQLVQLYKMTVRSGASMKVCWHSNPSRTPTSPPRLEDQTASGACAYSGSYCDSKAASYCTKYNKSGREPHHSRVRAVKCCRRRRLGQRDSERTTTDLAS